MTMETRSGNVFYPSRFRWGRARGHNHGRGFSLVYTQYVSNSSSEEFSWSPSPIRSPCVQRMFSINLQPTRNSLYQEDPKTRKGHTSPNNTTEFLFRQPFQPIYTKTYHIPTMAKPKLEHGECSRDQDFNL